METEKLHTEMKAQHNPEPNTLSDVEEALKGLTCSCSADTIHLSGRGNGSHSRWAQQRPLSPPELISGGYSHLEMAWWTICSVSLGC